MQRGINRINNYSVNSVIVAHGQSPEKMNRNQRWGLLRQWLPSLAQLFLACILVIFFWLYWPAHAAAPGNLVAPQAQPVTLPPLEEPLPVDDVAEMAAEPVDLTPAEPSSSSPEEASPASGPGRIDVNSLLAQITANGNAESQAEQTALEMAAPAADSPDAGNIAAALRANPLRLALETAIDKARGSQAGVASYVVEAQPQIQSAAGAVAAPATSYPSALTLGQPWETFTPQAPAEIEHYWLDVAFQPGYNQLYSPNYQFGSTAGGRYRAHHGVDISNPSGTPVLSMAAGEIVHAGPDNPTLLGPYNNFYGNSVVLLLDRKLSTPEGDKDVFLLYGHLSEVHVQRGQRVEPGMTIGAVGMTGIAIGPHLHVEVRVGQNSYMTAVNPVLWMRPMPGTGSVAVRLLNAEGRSWVGAKVSLLRYEGEGARWVSTIETYRDEERLRSNPLWGENGALSNLGAGNYYIAAEINGEKVGQNITVRAGETTFVELRTQQ